MRRQIAGAIQHRKGRPPSKGSARPFVCRPCPGNLYRGGRTIVGPDTCARPESDQTEVKPPSTLMFWPVM